MRHHYVPQFLQRPWAEKTRDGKLEVFRLDLPNLTSDRHRPKYVGYENDLFALSMPTVAGMDQQAIEKRVLRRVDQQAALVRDRLLQRELTQLSDEEKSDWIRFLTSLRARQPHNVEKLRLLSEERLRAALATNPGEYDSINSDSDLPTLEAWTEHHFPGLIKNFGFSIFHKLIDDPKIGNKIARTKWWLWNFKTSPHELLLSDNPCIVAGDLGKAHFLVALPIAPRFAFIATSSEHVANNLKRQSEKNLVILLNESSLNQARARIYATDRSSETFIRNRLIKLKALRSR